MFCHFSVYVKAVGGEVPATSTLAPKIGPLGLVSWVCGTHLLLVSSTFGHYFWGYLKTKTKLKLQQLIL